MSYQGSKARRLRRNYGGRKTRRLMRNHVTMAVEGHKVNAKGSERQFNLETRSHKGCFEVFVVKKNCFRSIPAEIAAETAIRVQKIS